MKKLFQIISILLLLCAGCDWKEDWIDKYFYGLEGDKNKIVSVPEPSTALLFTAGILFLIYRAKKAK